MLRDLFYSVEDVWIIWLLSIGVVSFAVYRALRSRHWRSLRQFLADERGASYALPYLMTFPVYLMFVCLVIQSTMILIVKIGVMHSAHAAVRSAVVWRPAHPYSDSQGLRVAKEKARHAAVVAITPYASGLNAHRQVYRYSPAAWGRAIAAIPESYGYNWLYRRLANHSEAKNYLANPDFVRRKFKYASALTYVDLSQHSNRFNQELTANVRYRMPIHIPGTGYILGRLHWSRRFFYRDIRGSARLPLETPESSNRRLGIQYDPSTL